MSSTPAQSDNTDSSENKRAFIRLKLNSKVTLEASNGEQFEGRCEDMSGAGLMVASDAAVAVGDELVARIESKGSVIVYHTTVKRIVDADGKRKLALSIDNILD